MSEAIARTLMEIITKTGQSLIYGQIGEVWRECESPIELALLASIVQWFGSREADFGPVQAEAMYFWEGPKKRNTIGIYPQAQVGPYRVDILLMVPRGDRTVQLVVECDGHLYHEKTQEQAAADKSRDRWLLAHGIIPVRFTGSEIWKQPYRCFEEIEAIIGQFKDGL